MGGNKDLVILKDMNKLTNQDGEMQKLPEF